MPDSSSQVGGDQQVDQQSMQQLLVFSLAGEEYALGLTEIQEIVQTPQMTPVPNMPASVEGVANLRGRVVTIIDLQMLFTGKEGAEGERTHIIVSEKDEELFGLLVDSAEEVLRVPAGSLKETPELLQSHPHGDYLKGVLVLGEEEEGEEEEEKKPVEQKEAKGDRIILSLNLEKILSGFSAAAAEVPSAESHVKSEEKKPEKLPKAAEPNPSQAASSADAPTQPTQ